MKNYINIFFGWQIGLSISFGEAIYPSKKYISIDTFFMTIVIYLWKIKSKKL